MVHPPNLVTEPYSLTHTHLSVASMWVIASRTYFLCLFPPRLLPSEGLRLYPEPRISRTIPHILNRSHTSYLPAYDDGTDRAFRNVGIKLQTPGNHPEEFIRHSKHDEMLKSRITKYHNNGTNLIHFNFHKHFSVS
jgi:hypothetical protein